MSTLLKKGEIIDNISSKRVTYDLFHGVDSLLSSEADSAWISFNLRLIKHLKSVSCGDSAKFEQLVGEWQLEDAHWSWINKSLKMLGSEYEWFYLVVNSVVQGICVFYHPKASLIDKADIFYIEYVATAPWNRINPFSDIRFKGIGTILLRESLAYAVNNLKYRPGFSLHSLPKANGYYERIGMLNLGPDATKQNLIYFEMEQSNSEVFLHG